MDNSVTTTDPQGTEETILEAARKVFLRYGTAGTRMQQIADEADVNKALLHYYFDSKASLAEKVFVREVRRLIPPILEILASELELDEKVRSVVSVALEQLSSNPFLPGYLLSEVHGHPSRANELVEAVFANEEKPSATDMLECLQGQLEEEPVEGATKSIEAVDFVVNTLALCIFPFAARPMLTELLGLDDEAFGTFVERRKETLPWTILRGIRP